MQSFGSNLQALNLKDFFLWILLPSLHKVTPRGDCHPSATDIWATLQLILRRCASIFASNSSSSEVGHIHCYPSTQGSIAHGPPARFGEVCSWTPEIGGYCDDIYQPLFENKSIPRTCIFSQTRGRNTNPILNASIASINMASNTTAAASSLPPDLFDSTTLISLASTVLILAVAYGTSVKVLAPTTPTSYRVLFIWHAFDALIHFFLEGSFLYQVRMPFWASCFATR